jgi:hypothetical protein
MHPVVRDIINPQLSLATVVIRLSATVDRIYRDLLDSEHESRIQRPRGVDIRGFAIVLNKISNTAVNRIAPEWECAKEMAGPITERSKALLASPCECTIIARFGLPCRHKLLRAAREGFSLPISLVHPRRWLDGPPYEPSGWEGKYFDAAIDLSEIDTTAFTSLTQNEITRSALEMEAFREALSGEKQARFDQLRVAQNADLMEVIAGEMAFDQALPKRLPAPKPPAALVRKFKANDKTTKRGLTGAESAEKERQIAEAIEAKKKKDDAATAKKAEKERVAAVKAAEKKRIAAEKAIIAAAKIAEDERVKKAQEVVRIDQEEAEIARRTEEALQNAIEVVILLILLNNPIWN